MGHVTRLGPARGSAQAACYVSARFLATYVGGYAIWLVFGLSLASVPMVLVHTDLRCRHAVGRAQPARLAALAGHLEPVRPTRLPMMPG
jgi:heme exporter protein D